MLNVRLYVIDKRENSTKRPNGNEIHKDHPAILKKPTSILNPELIFDFGIKGNPSFYNYVYISDLGNRYYFVKDWIVGEGHLWTARLEVDVLASWKIEIGNSVQYVTRSAYQSDGSIIDNLYPAIGKCDIETSEGDIWPKVVSLTGGSYVVGIINKSAEAVGAVSYYVFTQQQFRNFMAYMLGDVTWLGTNFEQITDDLLKVLFNPFQYITNVMWYPDEAPKGELVESVPFGWWNIAVEAYKLVTRTGSPRVCSVTIPKHPQEDSRGKYLNMAPYSRYELDTRVWGIIQLDSTTILDATIVHMEYRIDYVTGIADMILSSHTLTNEIATRRGMYGVPIQIAQIGIDYLNSALTAVSNGASFAKSIGNPLSAIQSAASAIGNVIEASLPTMSTSGNNGTIANFFRKPTLFAKFLYIADEDNEDRGRPLCKKKKLMSLPGYQMIADPDIDITGTSEENRRIKSYLSSGFFYE